MNNITVTTTAYPQHKDITLLSVKGFIDTTTAPEFERAFQSVLGQKKYNLIIDLKDVDYISSAGWGIFIGEIKRIRGQKGNLFLTSMSEEVNETYHLLNFDSIIKSFPNVDQAVLKGFGKTKGRKGASAPAPTAASAAPAAAAPGNGDRPEAAAPVFTRPYEPPKTPWYVAFFKPWTWF
jgi:anti-sigma B factor antagonist